MTPFRCHNPKCAKAGKPFDFFAVDPVCPKCGADQREEDDTGIIAKREIIHFDPPHAKYADMQRGAGYNACTKKIKGMRTGIPTCVNCPRCLETPELKQAAIDWDCMADMPHESAFEAFKRVAPTKAREYETAQAGER